MAKKSNNSFNHEKKQRQCDKKRFDDVKSNYCNNPYNFIPLPDTVFCRYSSINDLPKHDVYTDGLLSGTITCTLKAETPICISRGLEGGENGFVQNANREYIIPGSSIRGLTRNNMTILGLGAIRPNEDFDDVMLSYRVIGSAKSSLKKPLQQDYDDILRVEEGQKSPVFSAYLVHKGSKYFIYPTSTPYIRVEKWIVRKDKQEEYKKAIRKAKEDNPAITPQQLSKIKYEKDKAGQYKYLEKNRACKKFVFRTADDIPVWYRLKNGKASQIIQRDHETENSGMSKGILVCPGWMKGQNSLYLFPEFDDSQPCFEWDEAYRVAYESDYKARENSLGGTDVKGDPEQVRKEKERRKDHWRLPPEGVKWPVFCYNYKVIGKNPYLRLTYKNTISKGLSTKHRTAGEKLTIDYPFALFGFTSQKTGDLDNKGKPVTVSYRSRVSFGDFTLQGKEHILKKEAIMGSPKITSFPDYVLPTEDRQVKNYNSDDFQLRGIKQYWLHKTQEMLPDNVGKDSATQFTFQTGKPEFKGEIRFQNLHRDELGLLLWCLKLDDGCYQTLGKGKPFGYGKMSVSIDSVKSFCLDRIYEPTSFGDSSAWTKDENVETLIQEYQMFISHKLSDDTNNTSIIEQNSIQDFMFMHRVLRDGNENHDDIRYMKLSEYQNRSNPLPTISQQREQLREE